MRRTASALAALVAVAACSTAPSRPAPGAPTLLRVDGAGGHGGGTPLSAKIDLTAHTQAFILAQLGVAGRGRR